MYITTLHYKRGDYRATPGVTCWNPDYVASRVFGAVPDASSVTWDSASQGTGLWCDVSAKLDSGQIITVRVNAGGPVSEVHWPAVDRDGALDPADTSRLGAGWTLEGFPV